MSKLPQDRNGSNNARGGGGDIQPLQFASAKFIMRLTRGHCPCHDDEHPSFSAKDGREPGTTIVACGAGCSQGELLAHFRKLGYRLGPMKMAPPRRTKRPITVRTSVAFKALTLSERRMYELIAEGENPTYNDFVAEGVHRQAVPRGIRALQALGLVVVRRAPRRKGCLQYEQNEYWPLHDQWLRSEPSGSSKAAKAAALDTARTAARAARSGGEDISQPAPLDASRHRRKAESANDLHAVTMPEMVGNVGVSEVRVRGTDSGTESYVERSLASLSPDSDRPTLFMKRTSGGGGDADPPPPADDLEVCGYACHDGCIAPLRHKRNAITGAMGPGAPAARAAPAATPVGATSEWRDKTKQTHPDSEKGRTNGRDR
jgi:hypothetical protein